MKLNQKDLMMVLRMLCGKTGMLFWLKKGCPVFGSLPRGLWVGVINTTLLVEEIWLVFHDNKPTQLPRDRRKSGALPYFS